MYEEKNEALDEIVISRHLHFIRHGHVFFIAVILFYYIFFVCMFIIQHLFIPTIFSRFSIYKNASALLMIHD